MSLILSIDTSSPYIVLSLGDEKRFIAGKSLWADRSHQSRLHPAIESFLKSSDVDWQDIHCLGVVAGPGSFTGLRISIAAVKGFAWVLKKPVVTVSALDCLATNAASAGCDVVPVVDAKRSHVYTACYRAGNGGIMRRVGAERSIEPARWIKRLHGKTLFLGDGISRYPEIFKKSGGHLFRTAPESDWTIYPVSLWRRSVEEVCLKRWVSPRKLAPSYLRLPEVLESYNKKRKQRRK